MIKGSLRGYHFYQEAHCCWFSIKLRGMRNVTLDVILVAITKKWGKRESFKHN